MQTEVTEEAKQLIKPN